MNEPFLKNKNKDKHFVKKSKKGEKRQFIIWPNLDWTGFEATRQCGRMDDLKCLAILKCEILPNGIKHLTKWFNFLAKHQYSP